MTREEVDSDLGPLALDGVPNRAHHRAAVALPLHEIVLDALVQDLDRVVLVALAAEHDDRHERIRFLDLGNAIGAAAVGKIQVEQHDVELVVVEGRHGVGELGDACYVCLAVLLREGQTQEVGVVRVVLYQQYLHLQRCPLHSSGRTLSNRTRGLPGRGSQFMRAGPGCTTRATEKVSNTSGSARCGNNAISATNAIELG
jgi:hypothetical protein